MDPAQDRHATREHFETSETFTPNIERDYFALVEDDDTESGQVRLDVVEASHEGLQGRRLRASSGRARRLWRDAFQDANRARELVSFLDDFHGGIMEVTLTAAQREDPSLKEGSWARVQFSSAGRISSFQAIDEPTARALHRILGSDLIKHAPAELVNNVLSRLSPVAAFVAYDVGQGSANALLDNSGYAIAYSDAGAGFGRNAPARVHPWEALCTCVKPVIFLSHWDTDHWAAANHQADLLMSTWIAPKQVMGKTHSQLVARILQSGGEVHLVKRSSRPLSAPSGKSPQIELHHATGRGKGRNDTGIVLTVHNRDLDALWLFPGDADYTAIPTPPGPVTGLTATHHGAAPRDPSTVPRKKTTPYARLVYSFGPKNSYSHPRVESRNAHRRASWPDQDVRETSERSLVPSRGAVAVGWDSVPQARCLGHFASAHSVTPLT